MRATQADTQADTLSRFYRQLARVVIGAYLLAAILIASAAAWYAWQNRSERIAGAIDESRTLARALDEHAQRAFDAVDVVLHSVADDLVAAGGVANLPAQDLRRDFNRLLPLLPQVTSLFVFRRDLQLHAASDAYPAASTDGAALSHVRMHRDGATTSLYIGTPQLSAASGRWTIPVSRRITGADGAFLGVIGAVIDSNHFDTFYRELDLQPDENLVLVRADGILLFRFPPITALQPGADLAKISPIFQQPRPLKDTTTLRIISKLDGRERIITYREIVNPALLAGHAHEVDILLAPWRRDTLALGVWVFVVLGALSVLLWVVLHQIRRRAAAEQRHHAMLESRVRERTAALKHTNEELEAFSYSVSHDLRSPLNVVGGYMYLLRHDYAPAFTAEAKEMLDEIEVSVKSMTRLIEDLLGMARVSRQRISKDRVDLSALAAEITQQLAAAHPQHAVEVQIMPGIVAQADAGLLRIALQNLLGNAWKYSAKNPRPRIEFGAQTSGGEYVYHVRDNGAGFDMKDAEKLFRPFQRLPGSQGYEGTGIGLTTVARIIQRHGGRIWADSAPGEGATFRFTLPEDPADN
jgi:signal transduction histidine kinase